MRLLSAIILVIFSQVGLAQLVVKPIIPQKKEVKTQSVTSRKVAPASLPFWDDFSITHNSADSIRIWGSDTTSQWDYHQSKNVFINSTLAINPPTYKVATFDGLDANGAFHSDNELRLADQLQSDTIDLSAYTESDSIFISFYWQAGGNVEMPDGRDSLRLQFYDPNDPIRPWKKIWSMKGSENLADSIFTQEIWPVKPELLTDKFIFRFQSFGDLNGPFDAWHVDWIYLNKGRNNDDLSHLDRAFSSNISSPFSPFYSIPIHQLAENPLQYFQQSILISNLSKIEAEPLDFQHTIKDLSRNEILYFKDTVSVNILFPADSTIIFVFDSLSLAPISAGDSIVIESEIFHFNKDGGDLFLDNTNIDLKINDTIRTQQFLHNYYAYDDGTAEYAAGTNVLGGQIAVKFWLEERDTLTHIAIHFPNIAPSAAGKSLTLNIFKSLEENNLALRSQQINVKSDSTINGLTYYKLSRPVVLSDTFYISYQQNTNDYIGVGFDRSNMEASGNIYENSGDGWKKNIRLKGALMIRAIFEDVEDYSLGYNSQPEVLTIFPNPTKGIVAIQGDYISIEVIDISGRVFLQEQAKPNHDLSKLEVGLYLLRVHQPDGERTYKIIKK